MSAASARHFPTRQSERAVRPSGPAPRESASRRAATRARAERRRRERHFARRRRDLLEDAGLALFLTIVLISITAGLGVIALLEVPLATGLLATVLVPRIRRRRALARGGTRSSRRR